MAHWYKGKISLPFLLLSLLSLTCLHAGAQYYYKDLVTTGQINQSYRLYKNNKVSKVTLTSYQGKVAVTEGFICEQTVSLPKNQVITYTKTADAGESYFTALYNAQGQLVKTIDSTGEAVSTSLYEYDASARLIRQSHETRAIDNSSRTIETHTWQYSTSGKPLKMLRVKNGSDSTIISFVIDEKGNVSEEDALRKGNSLDKVYYYYDDKNRLTDVVRFNRKANRLLPDYIFEYEDDGQLSAMTIVPEGSSDYQKWYYAYEDTGLKTADLCYNKQKELLGKVEYHYTTAK